MFGWLGRLFSGSQGFDPGDGEVYRFRNGVRWVRADPLAILRRLAADEGFDITREMKMSVVPGADGYDAIEKLMTGIRAAFLLPSVDAGGLTDPQCLALLRDFMGWLEKKT